MNRSCIRHIEILGFFLLASYAWISRLPVTMLHASRRRLAHLRSQKRDSLSVCRAKKKQNIRPTERNAGTPSPSPVS